MRGGVCEPVNYSKADARFTGLGATLPVGNAIMGYARRHHYLPQYYLKGFGKPRQRGKAHYVQVFDRSGKTFRTNIINVAIENDFNRVEIDGHPPDAFERSFANFESEAAPALGRILKTGIA